MCTKSKSLSLPLYYYYSYFHLALDGDFAVDSMVATFETTPSSTVEACINITITNDVLYEGDHGFGVRISLTDPLLSINADNEVIFTITDGDGEFEKK